MMLLAVVVLLLLAAGAFIGANFCAPGSPAQQSLCGLGGSLVGLTLPQVPALFQAPKARDSQAGHARLHSMCAFGLVGLVTLVALMLTLPTAGCRVKPTAFYEATVDCAKINPERTATSAAVVTCLTAAVAGNAIACIAQLPQVAHWTIDEATCVIADIAQKENAKVGTALATTRDLELRNEAVDFLTRNRIRIANSYPGL